MGRGLPPCCPGNRGEPRPPGGKLVLHVAAGLGRRRQVVRCVQLHLAGTCAARTARRAGSAPHGQRLAGGLPVPLAYTQGLLAGACTEPPSSCQPTPAKAATAEGSKRRRQPCFRYAKACLQENNAVRGRQRASHTVHSPLAPPPQSSPCTCPWPAGVRENSWHLRPAVLNGEPVCCLKMGPTATPFSGRDTWASRRKGAVCQSCWQPEGERHLNGTSASK